MRKKQKTKTE